MAQIRPIPFHCHYVDVVWFKHVESQKGRNNSYTDENLKPSNCIGAKCKLCYSNVFHSVPPASNQISAECGSSKLLPCHVDWSSKLGRVACRQYKCLYIHLIVAGSKISSVFQATVENNSWLMKKSRFNEMLYLAALIFSSLKH